MRFSQGNIYHVYNRGNDRRPIFFKRDNYLYFLKKIDKYISPCADILAWVLMPNHFHLLIHANERTCKVIRREPVLIDGCTEGVRVLLSSYSRAIQRQESMTGNLFQQNTKSKCVSNREHDYSAAAFHYIHQNPYRAGLVEKLGDWEFSSIHEYAEAGSSSYTNFERKLCNTDLARNLLDVGPLNIFEQTYRVIPGAAAENIFQTHRHEAAIRR